jgi:hypothetical protein
MNTAFLCVIFILIGYSSFAQIVIRSNANTPLDENNPENVFSFISYLKREQYGERPLLYGQNYNAKIINQENGAMNYARVKGAEKYVEAGFKVEPVYEPEKCTVFPRMWSSQPNHINEYKKYANIKGDRTPSFGDNFMFFFTYQLGEMYWRYFMWNFAGKQNDIQVRVESFVEIGCPELNSLTKCVLDHKIKSPKVFFKTKRGIYFTCCLFYSELLE